MLSLGWATLEKPQNIYFAQSKERNLKTNISLRQSSNQDVHFELRINMDLSTISNVLYGYFNNKRNKLIWTGSLEDLKALVLTEIDEDTAQSTTWRSPLEWREMEF